MANLLLELLLSTLGRAVAGRGFDSRWCHWNFSVYFIYFVSKWFAASQYSI